MAHAPYTMNLASARKETYEFACTVIREDVARMDDLRMENLVFHPDSHTEIGSRFEELREIRDRVKQPERIGICLDTCHVSAAGYDIIKDLDGVYLPRLIKCSD